MPTFARRRGHAGLPLRSDGAQSRAMCIRVRASTTSPMPISCVGRRDWADFRSSARRRGVGQTVLDAVRATRAAVGTNTNLGTLLLLAPLAAVPQAESLSDRDWRTCWHGSPADDTKHVYEAIRISCAGGLGRAEQADVFADPPADLNLVEAMRLAADRDSVARQYTNDLPMSSKARPPGSLRPWLARCR